MSRSHFLKFSKIQQQAANFEQQVIYPTAAINNAHGLASQLQGQLRQINQLYRLPINSATLSAPQQFEQALLSHNPQALGQLSQNYAAVYGTVMAPADAPQPLRDLVDMSDAEAQAALKKAVELDALADVELAAADQINQQIQNAAPGNAPILVSAAEISRQLERPYLTSIQKELLEYWQQNISSFPDGELTRGLQQLTSEVQEDLMAGPKQTVAEIHELQTIVLSRNALNIDLTTGREALHTIEGELIQFINTLDVGQFQEQKQPERRTDYPIMKRLSERYDANNIDFPWYVGLVNPDAVTGDLLFYSDLPGYTNLDRPSLIKILSSKIFAENGPQSFFIKTREVGLAYAIWLTSDPAFKLLWNYADRSPDIPQLITLLNAIAEDTLNLKDSFIVDYALRQIFTVPRAVYTPSVRGIAIAQDLRDGNDPHTVRKFSEAILNLRRDPNLLSELTRAAVPSICGILLEPKCRGQQESSHSIFFFVGSSKMLSDIGARLSVPKLLRLSPSDYWLQ